MTSNEINSVRRINLAQCKCTRKIRNIKVQWCIIKPASRLRHATLFHYIVLHSRCIHYGLRCITLHRVWICMALASALALTSTHYVKQQKDRKANNHLHPARLRIHVAWHYTRVAFASRFPLRRHYVGIPLRTEHHASRWITSALHYTLAAVVFTLHWR